MMRLTEIVKRCVPDAIAIKIERCTTEQERGFRLLLEEAEIHLKNGAYTAFEQVGGYLRISISSSGYAGRFSEYFNERLAGLENVKKTDMFSSKSY